VSVVALITTVSRTLLPGHFPFDHLFPLDFAPMPVNILPCRSDNISGSARHRFIYVAGMLLMPICFISRSLYFCQILLFCVSELELHQPYSPDHILYMQIQIFVDSLAD